MKSIKLYACINFARKLYYKILFKMNYFYFQNKKTPISGSFVGIIS